MLKFTQFVIGRGRNVDQVWLTAWRQRPLSLLLNYINLMLGRGVFLRVSAQILTKWKSGAGLPVELDPGSLAFFTCLPVWGMKC